MNAAQSISSFINHKVDDLNKFVDKVARSPGISKKVLQVTTKTFKTYDLYTLKSHFPEFYASAKGVVEFVELYNFFGEVIYWINPFTNRSLDQQKLIQSLDKFLSDRKSKIDELENSKFQEFTKEDLIKYSNSLYLDLARDYNLSEQTNKEIRNLLGKLANLDNNKNYTRKSVLEFLELIKTTVLTTSPPNRKAPKEIVREILEGEKEHYSREEVLLTLKDKLLSDGYFSQVEEATFFQELQKAVIIQQTSRPLTQRLYMFFFTVADFGGSLQTFQKWRFIDLATLSAKIGSQSPVFRLVIDLGADTVLGVIGSAGLVLALGEAVWNSADQGWKYFHFTDEEEKKAALKKFTKHLIEVAVAGTDLVSTAVPIFFVVSPQTVLILALIAKGTALVAVFTR